VGELRRHELQSQIGKITAPARFGVLSSSLASHADPDTTNTLSVNLTTSKAQLGSLTTAEADNGASLCLIGNELIGYRDAALTSAYHYDLTYLRRGQRGSTAAAHSSGATFIRLDDAFSASRICRRTPARRCMSNSRASIISAAAFRISPASRITR
jgi:hypothetical protein